ncbi:VWA domain-containing protein [Streptomyces anandii]|uniref:VWA domain-containing protein n=1 Tax=Streptomyces anandii TaxID=285454 RepID=UPI0036F8B632
MRTDREAIVFIAPDPYAGAPSGTDTPGPVPVTRPGGPAPAAGADVPAEKAPSTPPTAGGPGAGAGSLPGARGSGRAGTPGPASGSLPGGPDPARGPDLPGGAAAGAEGLVREALRAAARGGLRVVEPVAHSADAVRGLLARHPDAVILVHPGRPRTRHRPGGTLWELLCHGVALRLYASPATPVEGEALLVVDLPQEDGDANADPRAEARRAARCRGFADSLGLTPGPVLGRNAADWAEALRSVAHSTRPQTAVVHPDVTPPDTDSPDALLWEWLWADREIRSVSDQWPRPWELRRGGGVGGSDRRERAHPSHRVRRRQWLGLDDGDDGGPVPASADPAGPPSPAGADTDAMRRRFDYEHSRTRRGTSDDLDDPDLPEFLSTRGSDLLLQKARLGHDDLAGHRPPFLRRTGEPLPHDGLFIRRNSAFGTRSPLGVRDLIEQGVIIGQEQIRFDDFVAARTDQVPGPPPGRAIGVSHGLAAAEGDFRADEATTHFLEITLKAGEAHPEDAPGEPLPVNFVFVVDTSGSMHGEKLDCVKAALQGLYDRLRPADCLGVITFDHHVRTVLAATAKQDLPAERFAQVVGRLRADGGTDINLGVQYGIDEIARNAVGGRTVNCLYLFSDGDPTSGERDWIRIRTNIAAKLRGDLTVSCFGFGSDARMPELAALAGLSGGHSTFVTRPEQVGADLLADLGRRDHLAAIDIQLKLDIAPEVEIRHLYGHDLVTDPRARAAVLREAGRAAERARQDYGAEALPDLITEDKGIRIFAPDLAFEETYWIVLELSVPPGHEVPGIGGATVQYVDTLTREPHRHELGLGTGWTLPEETVTVHAVGLWTSEVTFQALDDLYDRDRNTATKRLAHHIQVLRAAHSRLPAKEFRDDQVTLQKLITLTGTLDARVSFSDMPQAGGAMAPAIMAMSDFGRVRSGFWPHY